MDQPNIQLDPYGDPPQDRHWQSQARPEQLEPQTLWDTWLILAGRGFGKTRTGAETVWEWIKNNRFKRIALVGKTLIEARQVMIEGESGLLSVIDPNTLKRYSKSEGILEFKNGAIVQLFGGDRYERFRGPQFDAAWVDELAKFKHSDLFWQQLSLCLRLGEHPKCIVTTTPRPNQVLDMLLKDDTCAVTRGTTFDNACNLAPRFLQSLERLYKGTRLEAQEIYAQYTPNTDGSLWNQEMITYEPPPNDDWKRIVVSVDPADTNSDIANKI